MKNQLEKLTNEERKKLISTPVLVSLLAAGSDGLFDKKERSDAIEMSHLRTFTANPELRPFYKLVETSFKSELDELLEKYKPLHKNIVEIERLISESYGILDKLSPEYIELMKESLKSYAEHVANVHPTLSDIFDFSIFKLKQRY